MYMEIISTTGFMKALDLGDYNFLSITIQQSVKI